jgi:uncharacterized membrane protein YgcG
VRCAALLLITLLAGSAPAHARSLEIRDFSARVTVVSNGTIVVTERITVRFDGSWNGIQRAIPVEYRTDRGLRHALRLRIRSVTDGAGNTLRHESSRDGHYRRLRIHVPDARDATRTVVLTYEVTNALRFFETHDELYWNVTGDEWEIPIRSASAEIVLPSGAAGIRAVSFAGARGASDGVTSQPVGNMVVVRAGRPLGHREGLTVVVGWNPGVVSRPTAVQRAMATLAANSVLAVPVLAFFAMFGLWRRYGRDPDPGSIYVRYEPPPDMSPAEAGTLMDDSADLRDITATLVDLAVRGFVEITEKRQEQLFGLIRSRDYELQLLHPERWPQLKPHERALLQALSVHSHADCVLLSALQNQFYKHLPEIRKHLHRTLTDGGYYVRRPDHVRAAFVVGAVALAGLLAGIGLSLGATHGVSEVATLLAAALTLVVVAGFGWLMPARTQEGARAHAWLRGFEEFLSRVEKDRLQRMIESPEAFERFLPFAMAFGVERNWARAFEGIARQPPQWYHSSADGSFRPALFVADLGRLASAAGSAMTSAPRGSSSAGASGFGGGGFSGGGFGGGGGGGF